MKGFSAALRTLCRAGVIALAFTIVDADLFMAGTGSPETEAASDDMRNDTDLMQETQEIHKMKDAGGIQAGDLIWFGTKPGKDQDGGEEVPVSWRVLDPESMLLLSEEVLGKENGPACFDAEMPYTNLWKDSNAKAWCDDFFEKALSPAQQEAVLPTSGSDAACEVVSDTGKEIVFDAEENILDQDRIFFLSAQEVKSLLPEAKSRVGYYDGAPSSWWLRSPVANPSGRHLRSPVAGIVTGQESSAYEGARESVIQALGIEVKPAGMGDIRGSVVDNTLIDAGMRPALHLDPSRILFAAPALEGAAGGTDEAGRPTETEKTEVSGKTEGTGLQMVESLGIHEWRLTIADPSLSASFETVSRSGDSLTVACREISADTDEDLFVSAAVLDQDGLLKASGRISRVQAGGGNVTVDLSGIPVRDTDRLFLYLEAGYGVCGTGYAGGWTEIS